MRPRMICLHASEANVEIIDREMKEMPFDIKHEVDTHLLSMIRSKQPLELQKAYVVEQLNKLMLQEPALLFVTCTNYVALIDEINVTTHIPILKIDEILYEQLKGIHNPIKMLFTNKETIRGTMQRFRQFVSEDIEVEVLHIPDVFDWYLAGDTLRHDQKVLMTLLELDAYENTVVVAQLSMSRIASIYSKLSGNEVLSPVTALKEYMNKLI